MTYDKLWPHDTDVTPLEGPGWYVVKWKRGGDRAIVVGVSDVWLDGSLRVLVPGRDDSYPVDQFDFYARFDPAEMVKHAER